MSGDSDRDGLKRAVASVIALESLLEESLSGLAAKSKRFLETPEVMDQLHLLVTGQREALQAHLQGLASTSVPPIGSSVSAAFEPFSDSQSRQQGEEAMATLRALATAFAQTAFAYAVLHALAHRFYEVATADLADQHRRNYIGAVHAIHGAVGDVAIQELQEAGHACRCECPACSPGICLCWHVHVDPDVTGPVAPTEGIVVRTPRANSNAEKAGLRGGDVILSVNGREVHSYQDMLDRMREHQPGEDVELRVGRGTGDAQTLSLKR